MDSSKDTKKVQLIPQQDGNGDTPFHLAIKENHPAVFNLLLEECNVNAKNLKGETPLHYTVLYNRLEFAKTLINNGAIVEVKDIEGKTPLYVALAEKNVQMAEILFNNGAVLNERNLTDMGPLRTAAYDGNLEMVKLLMLNGCNKVDIPKTMGSSLQTASRQGHLEVLKYLMKNVSKSSATITKDELGLLQAVIRVGRLPILKYLVDVGVKTDSEDIYLYTFSHKRCYDIGEYLITRMSIINAKTYFSENQLHSAVRASNVETVRALVNEFEPDSFDSKLAVHIAVENGNEEILEVLLNAGYSIESCFKYTSPLHVAATFEHTRLVELLLKAGADVNSQTMDGVTPLHFAATTGQPTVVKFLLESGADPTKICNRQRTPLSMVFLLFYTSSNLYTFSVLCFKKLIDITRMLILSSKNYNRYEYLLIFVLHVRALSNNSEQNNLSSDLKVQISEDVNLFHEYSKNLAFHPELARYILNYLTNEEIESVSKAVIECRSLTDDTPEILHLLMEYNDSKSCCNIEIKDLEESYQCLALVIGYSRNVEDLLSIVGKSYSAFHCGSKPVKPDVLKLVIARLVLLMGSSYSSVFEYDEDEENEVYFIELENWREKCEEEIESMQMTNVDDNLNITFYDILTKSVNKLAMYTRNENFLIEMESSYVKFPAYANFLKNNVEIGKRRKDFIDECLSLMNKLVMKIHKIQISNNDIGHIFQFLSVVDLRRFSAACSYNIF